MKMGVADQGRGLIGNKNHNFCPLFQNKLRYCCGNNKNIITIMTIMILDEFPQHCHIFAMKKITIIIIIIIK